jgi:hypothetical protein
MHLTPDELIDLADGSGPESAETHMRACEICRGQVAALQESMSSAASVEVPEPSPLFWEQLSARVRDAVSAEPPPSAPWAWTSGFLAPRLSWSSAAVAAVVAAVAVAIYVTAPRDWPSRDRAPESRERTVDLALQPFGAADDPSLALVADLTGQLDPGALAEAGWTNHAGGVEEAVADLTGDERLELQRLLKEAMAKADAS